MVLKQESQPARTTVIVQGQLVTLPQWLEEEASSRVLEKALFLVEQESRFRDYEVIDGEAAATIVGSRGDHYTVKVTVEHLSEEKPPMNCDCPHGVFGRSGICYHKAAVVLRFLKGGEEKKAEEERIAREKREEIDDIFGGADW
ncbi:MAG: hypothetical protein GF308_21865 [Candidatus Heimdallarchaeota archaeon]|nr:hypothetical protein [Candidatus Heimdallarchaeota archaeon]